MIPIVVWALGTVTKWLIEGLEENWRVSKPHHWDQSEYCEDSGRLKKSCCHLTSCGISISKRWCEKLSNEKNNNKEKSRPYKFLSLAGIFRRVLETCGDLLSRRIQWNHISYNWCENSNYNKDDKRSCSRTKNLLKMWLMVIPFVFSALRTICKSMKKDRRKIWTITWIMPGCLKDSGT